MRRHFLTRLLAILPLGWLAMTARGSHQNFSEAPTMTPEAADPVSLAFSLDTLKQKQAQEKRHYFKFIDVSTLSMGLYALPAGAQDKQSPHEEDEVYIINEGKAVLDVEGEQFPATKGSILFVKARAKHHFHDIEKDLYSTRALLQEEALLNIPRTVTIGSTTFSHAYWNRPDRTGVSRS